MIKVVRGIIISEVDYSETSKIINVLTSESKIIGILCKGAKSIKSKLRVSTSKFSYGDFHLYYKEDKLSTLITVDVLNEFRNIKSDIILIGYLGYIVELSSQVAKQNTSEKIFSFLISILTKINEGLNPMILTNILEIKLLDYLGIGLNLDSCSLCGTKTNIITIDGSNGGLICKKCFTNEIIVDLKIMKLLRLYYYVDIDTITKLDISHEICLQINDFINNYYEKYAGLYLNSKKFLEEITSK